MTFWISVVWNTGRIWELASVKSQNHLTEVRVWQKNSNLFYWAQIPVGPRRFGHASTRATPCVTASVNSFTADLSAALLLSNCVVWLARKPRRCFRLHGLSFDVARRLKTAAEPRGIPPSHKRALKASIRRLAWDDCAYYGDSLNQ